MRMAHALAFKDTDRGPTEKTNAENGLPERRGPGWLRCRRLPMIMGFFNAHACRDRFVGYAEGSAEPTAIIGAIDRNNDDTVHFGKEISRLIKWGTHDLGRSGNPETPKRAAAIAYGHRVMKFCPRKRVDPKNVVQEFHQLKDVFTNMLHGHRLFEAIEVTADLFDAASGRSHDAIKLLKVFDEEMFSRLCVLFIAAIGHGCPQQV